MAPRPATTARAGFALTELSLSVLLLGSMMIMAGFAADRGMGVLRQHRGEQQLIGAVQRAVQRVTRELEFAGLGAMTPRNTSPLWSESLSFRGCQGYDEGAASVAWSDVRTLRLEYEPGESDDGADNDGDGLVDEGQLVWLENEGAPEEQRIVLAHGVAEYLQGETPDGDDDNGNGLVDERGFALSFEGAVVTIHLSLQTAGANGTIAKTLETSVSVHN